MADPVVNYTSPDLYPKQRAAIFSEARVACIEASTKAGKTVAALAWLLEQSLKTGKEGRHYWWVAPVYSQAEIGWKRMKLRLPKNFYHATAAPLRITLGNGAIMEFKSSDRPDGLYGQDVYAVVLDEASRMRVESWDAIRSTLTYTKGPARIIGNVRGRKNWFYQLCRQAERGDDPELSYARITAYEAAEAGVLSQDEVESARLNFERIGRLEVFRELYLAEAAGDASNPFGIDAIRACIAPLSSDPPYTAGVDLAGRGAKNVTDRSERADRDYTAIVMLDRKGRACHVQTFQKPHGETESTILSVVGRTLCLMDSTGSGDPIVEWCQRTGRMNVEGYTFTPRTKQDLMERLAIAIQNGEITFPDGALVDELESFQYEHTRQGIRYAGAPGAHDDLVTALSLAVWRLPKRLGYAAAPIGVPGSSRWGASSAEALAWRVYEESKPGTVGMQDEPGAGAAKVEEKKIPVPEMIVGPGAGKWS